MALYTTHKKGSILYCSITTKYSIAKGSST